MRILFYIGSFQVGGSERQLLLLVEQLVQKQHEVIVVTLYPGGQFYEQAKVLLGNNLLSIFNSESACLQQGTLQRLMRAAKVFRKIASRIQPQLVCSYAYYCYLTSYLGLIGKNVKQVWSIRCADFPFQGKARWNVTLCKWLSAKIDLLIANSHAGKAFHEAHGFKGHWQVIGNGIDTKAFYPDRLIGSVWREAMAISPQTILIGLVGRLSAEKGVSEFLQAAASLAALYPAVRFCLIGHCSDSYRQILQQQMKTLGIEAQVLFVSKQPMLSVYNALDVFCSCSHSEGFPNVIGEAMACALPCIVTEAGDSAPILAQAQWTVPVRDVELLVASMRNMLDLSAEQRQQIGELNRQRLLENYTVAKMADATEQLFLQVIEGKGMAPCAG
jgi:glycosyltransferase involved in cell wall biosynthesis